MYRDKKILLQKTWDKLTSHFDSEGWKYIAQKEERILILKFERCFNESVVFVMELHEYPGYISIKSKIHDNIDSAKMRDVMLLTQHFNNMFNFGRLVVNNPPQSLAYVTFELEISSFEFMLITKAVNNIVEFTMSAYIEYRKAIQEMIRTGEDPVFIMSKLFEESTKAA
jgi:hypothetical protein